MEEHVLIAVSSDILRIGLRTIFEKDPRVTKVAEVATVEELLALLETHPPDLLLIHQTLVEDITALPEGRFAILVTEPNIHMLLMALHHKARGYFVESASVDLLLMLSLLTPGAFLFDSVVAGWLAQTLSGDVSSEIHMSNGALTVREHEILDLRSKGLSNKEIAQLLCISENTVKTHFLHITEKRGTKRYKNKNGKE